MYCLLDDIQTKRIPEQTLIQLTDDDSQGGVNLTVVNESISEADDLIDGYLRTRYPLPLQTNPPLLRRLSATIATYLLYGRRAEFGTPERITKDYEAAVSTLRAIQRGDVQLGVTVAEAEAPGTLLVGAPPALFGRDKLEEY